jgi:hypothetical protein
LRACPRARFPTTLEIAPEVVFAVRSLTDRWQKIHDKVAEYLRAGLTWVCVLDEQTTTLHLFHSDKVPCILTANDELYLPDLGEFRVPVRDFFA